MSLFEVGPILMEVARFARKQRFVAKNLGLGLGLRSVPFLSRSQTAGNELTRFIKPFGTKNFGIRDKDLGVPF